MLDNKPRTIVGKVIVTRNPCYHPGDIRVLNAIYLPGCHDLTDIIAFPTKGPRPHADEMSGGDLDGDKFFVCWDTDIVTPVKQVKPLSYENKSHPKKLYDLYETDMLRYGRVSLVV
jgi:RNA-dependent RNA polymerase